MSKSHFVEILQIHTYAELDLSFFNLGLLCNCLHISHIGDLSCLIAYLGHFADYHLAYMSWSPGM